MKSGETTFTVAAIAGGGAVLLTALVFFSDMMLNGDCAVHLQCAKLLLRGNMPYVGYVELNPPMAHYVHTIPVLTAWLLGTGVPMTFHVLVLGLALWSATMLVLLTARSRAIETRAGQLLAAATWIAFSVIVFANGGFGQREHLFVLAFVPWIYVREARHRGVALPDWMSIPIGLFGGMFILLKPHFLLIALVVEAWMLYRSRRWAALRATEVYLLVGIGIAYAVSLVAIAPLREAFFGRYLPFIAENYEVFNNLLWLTLYDPLFFGTKLWGAAVLVLVLAVLAVGRASKRKEWLQIEVLSLSFLFGVVIYVVQHKGWSYQLYPAVGFLALLGAVACIVLLETRMAGAKKKRVAQVWRPVLLIGCVISLVTTLGVQGGYETSRTARRMNKNYGPYVEYMRRHSSASDRIGFITTITTPVYPSLVVANRLPAGRHLIAFQIPMMYKDEREARWRPEEVTLFPYRGPNELTKREQRFLTEWGRDILKYEPKLIFIQSVLRCARCPPGFNVESYLRHAGWTEKYLKNYEPVDVVGRHLVYQRKEDAGAVRRGGTSKQTVAK